MIRSLFCVRCSIGPSGARGHDGLLEVTFPSPSGDGRILVHACEECHTLWQRGQTGGKFVWERLVDPDRKEPREP